MSDSATSTCSPRSSWKHRLLLMMLLKRWELEPAILHLLKHQHFHWQIRQWVFSFPPFYVIVNRRSLRRRRCTIAVSTKSNTWALQWMHWRGWRTKMLLLLRVRFFVVLNASLLLFLCQTYAILMLGTAELKVYLGTLKLLLCRWKWRRQSKSQRPDSTQLEKA